MEHTLYTNHLYNSRTYHTYNNHARTHSSTRRSDRKRISRRRYDYSSLIFNPVVFFAAAAAVVVIFSLCFHSVRASADEEKVMNKYYTSITVHSADTLWDIAEKYSYNEKPADYISNIKSINNMTGDTIYSGQDIIVYYYSEEIK